MIDTLRVMVEAREARFNLSTITGSGFSVAKGGFRNPMIIKLDCNAANTLDLSNGRRANMGRVAFLAYHSPYHRRGTCIAEIELGKVLYGHNDALLSFRQVDEAIRLYVNGLCDTFRFLDRKSAHATRADLYYQFKIDGSIKCLDHLQAIWKTGRTKDTYIYGGGESVLRRRSNSRADRIYDKSQEADSEARRKGVTVDIPSGIIRLELSLQGGSLNKLDVFAKERWYACESVISPAAIVDALQDEFPSVGYGQIANAADILASSSKAGLIRLLSHERRHLASSFLARNASTRHYHLDALRGVGMILSPSGQWIGIPTLCELQELFDDRDKTDDSDSRYYVQVFSPNLDVCPAPLQLEAVRPRLTCWSDDYVLNAKDGDVSNKSMGL